MHTFIPLQNMGKLFGVIFNSLPRTATILKNDKAKFKAALRKYLHTHTIFTL